jgi:RNA polymerase sigma-19 factor, ECF subfamily
VLTTDYAAETGIARLYADHHGWLLGWLRRRLGDTFLAADLTQDTFVSVMTSDPKDDIREPRAFLATIARRVMAHYHRRRALEESYLQALAEMPEAFAPAPETRLIVLEALLLIEQALDGLPPKVKEAFLLAHLAEMTYAEIAERLQVTTHSVKKYLTRASSQCLFALAVN